MAANESPSEVDCSCPVCCDIFKDPVLLLCGHSFCKYCLQEWWRQSTLKTCPVICRDAKKHKKHNCVPINEAAEDHKLQAQQTEKVIKKEFQKLYQFLQAEEAARIDAVRKEATLKSEAMKTRIVNLIAESSLLSDKIKTTEQEIKEDISLMLNVKSSMKRSQCNLPKPKTPSGALIDEAKHLGDLQFTVWRKMKDIIQYTPVILDPNSGNPLITVSEHLTRSVVRDKSQMLPDNPERLDSWDVLGSEGFSSGKHSWDVKVEHSWEIETGGYWYVGVATKRKHQTSEKIWGIYMCMSHRVLHELTPEDDTKTICKDSFPQKVRVQLDYDQGILSFLDLDRKTLVHTIKYTFTEPVFPYFRKNAKILPAELSVTVRQPR